ncbi:MAG TPA: ATP-dependent Clp protease adaptor ClpS [Crocinitomicaceae bacterium]|nr:ATP-dependent Clp protease adaptor ClpS [Crocinitomicaceae bacterium]
MQIAEEFDVKLVEQAVEQRDLIVYNDDFNTFDFVIESLVEVCKHELEQATQCTYIIHFKGKCQVKRGSFKSLKTMCAALLERGITAVIE